MLQVQLNIGEQAKDLIPGAESYSTSGKWIEGAFSDLIGNILTAVLTIAGILLLLYLVWGGIDWITAGGDSGKISNARNKIVQAVIGIIVLASTFAIISAFQLMLGIELLNINFSGSKSSTSTKTTITTPTKTDGSNLEGAGGTKYKLPAEQYVTD